MVVRRPTLAYPPAVDPAQRRMITMSPARPAGTLRLRRHGVGRRPGHAARKTLNWRPLSCLFHRSSPRASGMIQP